jgi:hypothetical protein
LTVFPKLCYTLDGNKLVFCKIPKPVWAVGFALEQTLLVVVLAVFSYVDFKVASAEHSRFGCNTQKTTQLIPI